MNTVSTLISLLQLRRCINNFRAEQPHQQALYYTSLLLAERIWTNEELLNCLDGKHLK